MTNPAAAATSAGASARDDWLPYAMAAGVLIALKLFAGFTINPIGDEAYYWLWGQKPALSYFDHPPLHAWLLAIVDAVLGWNLFTLRILTWVTFLGTLGFFWNWARRLAPEAPAAYFWRATAIYLAAPLFLGLTTIAFNDHLMMFLAIASAHFMLLFTERWEAGERRWRYLYLASVLLGLAVLTKYNAVFLGLGYAALFVVRRPLRSLFASPHTYLAGALSIAMQLPVFLWNYFEGFASYRFHLADRWSRPLAPSWEAPLLFLLLAVIVVSPFAIAGIVRYIRRPEEGAFAERARHLALCVFTISSVAMLGLASVAEVFFYWNVVAFLLLMPLLVNAMGAAWLFWLHMLYGTGMGLLLLFNQAVTPVGNVFGSYDWTVSSTYGWDEIGAAVEEARAEHPGAFVATTFYTTASQLGWAIRDAEVTAISPRHDQFDFWFDPAAHRGRHAIIVADPYFPIGYAAGQFARITVLRQVHVESYGRVIYSPTIYLAEDFTPPTSDSSR